MLSIIPQDIAYYQMWPVEHAAAQLIANLRVRKPENAAPFPSENHFLQPSRVCISVPGKIVQTAATCHNGISAT